ncbi:MAG: putative bifunctional diguanylate cyclase/phosphodiesterase [Candidatus Nanopelagicales bacterium]
MTLSDLAPTAAFRLGTAFDLRPLTKVEKRVFGSFVVLYALVVAVVMHFANTHLPPNPAVPIAHAWISSALSLVTAMMMYGLAQESGRRSPWALAVTYQAVGMILLAFPFFFPGAFLVDKPLLGSVQSAPMLFYSWQFVLASGLMVAVWLLWTDQRTLRRPRARSFWPPLVATCAGVGVLLAFVTFGGERLPVLIGSDGVPLTAMAFDLVCGIVAVSGATMAVMVARAQGSFSLWVASVAVIVAGQCLVSVNSARWDLGWYFNRGFSALAVTAMLLLLLHMMGRVTGRTLRMAALDSLTGVGNRAGIAIALHDEFARAELAGSSLAVLRVDIDGFKEINDRLGTSVGDQVLEVVAQRIQARVEEADQVGRTSGDEFAVVLCDDPAPIGRADEVARSLVAVVREPIVLSEASVLLTVSVGIARYPGDAMDHNELYAAAGLAMFAAKNSGGDRIQPFTEALSRGARDRARLRSDLAAALHERAFSLEYQPIVAAGSGRPMALEALVRWLRGDQRVAAGEFIAVAEQSGQIVALGRQVLDLLARDIVVLSKVLPAGGFVSVNLSAPELGDDQILAMLSEGPLRRHADRIVIEVTESLDLHPVADVESRLSGLRRAGYRVAIDDFGSGFSNFARLGLLKPHLLKVDRTLVLRAGTGDESGRLMLEAAAGVAAGLGCQVIAEGVETDSEHRVVAELDIAYEQGYRYCRPVPLREAVGQLKRGVWASSPALGEPGRQGDSLTGYAVWPN